MARLATLFTACEKVKQDRYGTATVATRLDSAL